MSAAIFPTLRVQNKELPTTPEQFGFLRPSHHMVADGEALRIRMAEDGYLYLPGVLDRELVLAARQECLRRLVASGRIDTAYPIEEARVPDGQSSYFMPDLAQNNQPLHELLYGGAMIEIFARFFYTAVRHFDFTWLRAVAPGRGTAPHCDWVYMGRGTPDLITAWTPLGDISLEQGGLTVLENSHHKADLLADYLRRDVDSYCANGPTVEKVLTGKVNWESWDDPQESWDGAVSHDPVALQNLLGGRWLTAEEYHAGDVLLFTMRTVHASLDNGSSRLRLSSDTRYQRADEPIDERWINGEHGELPIAHGVAGKRSRIC